MWLTKVLEKSGIEMTVENEFEITFVPRHAPKQ